MSEIKFVITNPFDTSEKQILTLQNEVEAGLHMVVSGKFPAVSKDGRDLISYLLGSDTGSHSIVAESLLCSPEFEFVVRRFVHEHPFLSKIDDDIYYMLGVRKATQETPLYSEKYKGGSPEISRRKYAMIGEAVVDKIKSAIEESSYFEGCPGFLFVSYEFAIDFLKSSMISLYFEDVDAIPVSYFYKVEELVTRELTPVEKKELHANLEDQKEGVGAFAEEA